MDKQRLLYLLNRQQDNRLTPAEQRELDQWYDLLNESAAGITAQNSASSPESETLLHEFRQTRLNQTTPVVALNRRRRFLRVAAVLTGICLTAGAYFFSHRQDAREKLAHQQPATRGQAYPDPLPGGNKAILTLANGMHIVLDSAVNGQLAVQGNTRVTKLSDGQLIYDNTDKATGETLYNSVHTPRGGLYELTLPDGTRVWLNSASSIRYPVSFTGKTRKVEMTGEAYFEVAAFRSSVSGERIPFQVQMPDGEEIDVLGTHFNVNAYAEEGAVKTTLLEGSVKMNRQQESILIRPGQQADFTDKGYRLSTPDLEKVMAWKTGFFDFDNLDLAAIMRQVGRWYDVDVVFDGTPRPVRFGGRISRNLPMSQILNMFEESGVAFRMDGKTLHVER